jgi:hypothetical protein
MRPNLSGIWIADLARCRFRSPAPARLTVGIEHNEDTIVEKLVSEQADGASQTAVFEFRIDGAQPGMVQAAWQGSALLVASTIQAGDRTYEFRDYWTLSDDGATLTMEHRDDALAGQICIFEKALQTSASG